MCYCSLLYVNVPCPSHKLHESGGGATPENRQNYSGGPSRHGRISPVVVDEEKKGKGMAFGR